MIPKVFKRKIRPMVLDVVGPYCQDCNPYSIRHIEHQVCYRCKCKNPIALDAQNVRKDILCTNCIRISNWIDLVP